MARRLEGHVFDQTIESRYLGEQQKLLCYTPPSYTPLSSYGVLICQDGSDYFQLGRLLRQAEELMKEAEIEETIIIGVPYPSVEERRKRYHPNGEKRNDYLRFLADELVPFLDEQFSIEPFATSRTLAGDSLAATVSLLAALEYPSLFGQVMMHSPYVNDTVIAAVDEHTLADTLSVYHVIGKQETAVKTTDGQVLDFLTPNRQLHRALKQQPITYTYDEFDGNHTWTYWQKDLPRALRSLLPY